MAKQHVKRGPEGKLKRKQRAEMPNVVRSQWWDPTVRRWIHESVSKPVVMLVGSDEFTRQQLVQAAKALDEDPTLLMAFPKKPMLEDLPKTPKFEKRLYRIDEHEEFKNFNYDIDIEKKVDLSKFKKEGG